MSQTDVHQPTKITGTLQNLQPRQKHGISVCTYGDLNNAGPVFNPFQQSHHGGPDDHTRKVGNLGNIETDEVGTAVVDMADPQIQLLGPHSIIGRSVVISMGEDDLGRGGHEQSLVNGNAGPRIAAGVVGLACP